MPIWLTVTLGILGSGTFGTLAAWLTNRHLLKAQKGKTLAEEKEIYSRIYQKLIADLNYQLEAEKKRYKEVTEEFEDKLKSLSKYIDELEAQTKRLTKQVNELTKENKELKKKIDL